MTMRKLVIVVLFFGLLAWSRETCAGQLFVGTATADITPAGPVALDGQFNLRIAKSVETPLSASVLAIQSRDGEKPLDAAVMVSCDLISIQNDVLAMVREEVAKRLPDLDGKKIFLSGTHTHTAPVLTPGKYPIPKDGVVQVEEYRTFLVERLADAIERAWKARAAGSFTWGLSHAAVAQNRRAVYANGSAQMYGRTDAPEFRSLEGYEDNDIGTLFFWDAADRLVSIVVDVSCTAQEVESRSAVNADFWHPVRLALQKRYGTEVCVLGWIGAAGDQSPHLMYRKAAEERMLRLRGINRMEEIARRIDRAVEEAFEAVENDRRKDVPLVHTTETVRLPMRLVTEAEYAEAKAACEQAAEQIAKNPKTADQVQRRMKWHEKTVRRFESQKDEPEPIYEAEIHVLRLGDVVICTNPFELFTDYGIRIKARSKAVQTFVIQLAGPGSYLPTEKAVRGGGYSAVVHSSLVGPEGGQVLVDRTVALIDALWQKPATE